MSGSKSLASFTNRTFNFSRTPSFRLAFDAAESNERFGRIQCQRGKKRAAAEERERDEDARWGGRPGREGQIEELVGGQNPGPVAPPRSKKRQERREQRKCQERSDGEGWVCQGH